MKNVLIVVTRLVKPAGSTVQRGLNYESNFSKIGYNYRYISQGVPFIDQWRKSDNILLRRVGHALTDVPWINGKEHRLYLFLSWINARKI